MKVEVYKAISEDSWIYYCPKCGRVRKHPSQKRAFLMAHLHAELEARKHGSLSRYSATSVTTATKSLTSSIRKEFFVSPS